MTETTKVTIKGWVVAVAGTGLVGFQNPAKCYKYGGDRKLFEKVYWTKKSAQAALDRYQLNARKWHWFSLGAPQHFNILEVEISA